MWRPWGKSTTRIHDTSSPSSPFSCSSFKDVQTLCADPQQLLPTTSLRRSTTIFHRVRFANSLLRAWSTRPLSLTQTPDAENPNPNPQEQSPIPTTTAPKQPDPTISIPGAEKRVVVYLTSLRVVRSTFEDCRAVQSILRGFRVSIDERDLSMCSGFLTELQQILGQTKLTLPRVFIGGRYIGGAEEVKQLHEVGELKNLVEGLPAAEPGVCDVCGGYRFILCDECNGSHKLYSEKGGFKSCTTCNENGLNRCPSCSCAPLSSV